MAKRDVSLIVRAKDEASKAFESVQGALESLLGVNSEAGASAAKTGSRFEELAASALILDKAYSQIVGAADKASTAFDRQQANIVESKAQLAALAVQAKTAAAAMDRLKGGDAVVGAGRDQTARLAELKQVEVEYDRLIIAQGRLKASIAAQEAGLEGQRSTLQQIGSTAIAAADAQARLAAAAHIETEALQQEAAAADRLSDIQTRINTITGVSRGDSAGHAARSAEILAEAAARDTLIQKLRAEQAAEVALGEAQEAQARFARFAVSAGSGKSAKDSASVFTDQEIADVQKFEAATHEAVIAERQMDAAAASLRAQLDPLAVIQDRLNKELAESVALYRAGKISVLELGAAEKLLADNANRAKAALNGRTGANGLFGLKSYELQNLSYQINDVFTQLASGTSITQTLGQQGGQILQIFPRIGSAVAAGFSSAPLIGFSAVLTAILLGLYKVNTAAGELRTFRGLIAASADGASYQAEALHDAAKELDRYGLSAGDAVKVVREFINQGLDKTRLIEFGRAAQDMADVLGIEVTDAAAQVAKAFTAGYDAIKKLDDATQFLTAAEREHIRALFEQGRGAEARSAAFEKFYDVQRAAADEMRGPWTDAVRSLSEAWESFLTFLEGNSIIQGVARDLKSMADAVKDVLDALSGRRTIKDALEDLVATSEQLSDLEADPNDFLGVKQAQIDKLRARLKALNEEIGKLRDAGAPGTGDTRLGSSEAQKKIDAELLRFDEEKLANAKTLVELYDAQTDSYDKALVQKRLDAVYTKALIDAQNKGASEEAAHASAMKAAQLEALAINKQITSERERQKSADEQAIKAFAGKVPVLEAGNDPNAASKTSTALGLGQFIEDTWLNLFRKYFPDEAANMGRDAILELRRDAETSKKMIEIYARENADVLKKAGFAVTEANLYLAAFLGGEGAKKVLGADRSTPLSQLLPSKTIDANKSVMSGKTAGDLRDFTARKTGDANSAESDVTARLAALEKERLKTQETFNTKVDDENEKRTLGVTALERQAGLTNESLLIEQRKQAVAEALLAKQQEIDRINIDLRSKGQQEITLTEAQKKAIEETTVAYFNLSRAKDFANARRSDVQQPVDDLMAQRSALLEQIDLYRQLGETALVDELEPQLAAVNARLDSAIEKAIAFYDALADNQAAMAAMGMTKEQIKNIVLQLQNMREETKNAGNQFLPTAKQINESIAIKGATAIESFIDKIHEGVNAWEAFGDSVRQFFADFLRELGDAILKQAIFNAVSGGSSDGGGGVGGFLRGIIGGIFHDGGTVGSGGRSRAIDPAWFQNATRMHSGGIVGLGPKEQAIIAEKGERIRTVEQEAELQRQLLAGGSGTGCGAGDVKVVNVFDPELAVSLMLDTRAGERAVLNIIGRNGRALQSAINS